MVVSLYGVSNKAWKMLWIFHDGESLSWNEVLDTAKVTRNGPYLLGASLAEGWVVFRFCPSNHTQSPTQLGVKFDGVSSTCDFLGALAASLHA
jgi:hypothetical protein